MSKKDLPSPIGQCQEFYQIENNWKEEEGESIAEPGLGAEAVLKAVDGAPGGVEDGALEHLLTLLAPLDGLVDV